MSFWLVFLVTLIIATANKIVQITFLPMVRKEQLLSETTLL